MAIWVVDRGWSQKKLEQLVSELAHLFLEPRTVARQRPAASPTLQRKRRP
jgi:hypothetical protein